MLGKQLHYSLTGEARLCECGELLLGNRFPLKMEGKVYRCCVRSAILYGSETWCLKENKKASGRPGRSGRGDREDWFEEVGCPETRQVEGPSASNCRRNGVNPAISFKGTTPDKY